MGHAGHAPAERSEIRTERFPVTDLYCVCCAESLEAALNANPHIERARVDFQNDVVEVGPRGSREPPGPGREPPTAETKKSIREKKHPRSYQPRADVVS